MSEKNQNTALLLDFNAAYKRLADEGVCDSPLGGEYERVRQEWIDTGMVEDIEAFIRTRASWVPAPGELENPDDYRARLEADVASLRTRGAIFAAMDAQGGGGAPPPPGDREVN